MKKILLSACAACVVSGCVQPAPITEPPVTAGIYSSVDRSRLSPGTTTVAIRAFQKGEKGTHNKEVTGVPCTVESDEVKAKVITPQEVIVPNFKQRAALPNRGLPSALVVTCEGGGMRGIASTTSRAKQVSTATGGGLAVALITMAATAAVANSTPWVYPGAVHVAMNPK